jgi:hypothetical protein
VFALISNIMPRSIAPERLSKQPEALRRGLHTPQEQLRASKEAAPLNAERRRQLQLQIKRSKQKTRQIEKALAAGQAAPASKPSMAQASVAEASPEAHSQSSGAQSASGLVTQLAAQVSEPSTALELATEAVADPSAPTAPSEIAVPAPIPSVVAAQDDVAGNAASANAQPASAAEAIPQVALVPAAPAAPLAIAAEDDAAGSDVEFEDLDVDEEDSFTVVGGSDSDIAELLETTEAPQAVGAAVDHSNAGLVQ